MPAVYPDLAAASASFITSAAPVELTYRRIAVEAGSFDTRFRAAYRLQNGDVTFVGGDISDTFSAVMPSHQEHDLLIVFAINGAGNSFPPSSTDSGWTTISFAAGAFPYRLAYKFAKTNSETVGVWIGATKTAIAVYRNARKLAGAATVYSAASTSALQYQSPTQSASAGSKLIWFGAALGELEASDTPSGTTTRVSSVAQGFTAPSAGIHDRLIPAGDTSVPDESVALGGTTTALALGVIVQFGIPDVVASSGTFTTSLNGDVLANTLQLISRRYAVELSQVFTTYRSFFDVDSATFTSAGSPVNLPRGFSLEAEEAEFVTYLTQTFLKRALRFLLASGGFASTAFDADFARGYFIVPSTGVFSATTSDVDPYLNAYLAPASGNYTYELSSDFIRDLIGSVAAGLYSSNFSQVGFRNDTPSPAGGGPYTLSPSGQGGSEPSYPSFLRPRYNVYNSVSKSRDLGVVNNFFGSFTGEIGSEVGASTLFFKLQTLGTADLKISKNKSNKYTDQQISVGILDANRKPLNLNDYGFAYLNEVKNTDAQEYFLPMPAGTYYFTVSSSLWQKIPYSVEIQAIRFSELEGSVELTMVPEGRFAIAKATGSAVLAGPLSGFIPTNAQLKRLNGALLGVSAGRGFLTTPSGVALWQMLPTGRLKLTHKINGAALMTGANVATLSSAPPYGGGYGP